MAEQQPYTDMSAQWRTLAESCCEGWFSLLRTVIHFPEGYSELYRTNLAAMEKLVEATLDAETSFAEQWKLGEGLPSPVKQCLPMSCAAIEARRNLWHVAFSAAQTAAGERSTAAPIATAEAVLDASHNAATRFLQGAETLSPAYLSPGVRERGQSRRGGTQSGGVAS